MKKTISCITAIFLFSIFVWNLSAAGPYEGNDIEAFPYCNYCGMDRNMFAHSRVLIEYEDGSAIGMCSIHCTAVHFAVNMDNQIRRVMVGDYSTKKLTDAEAATWVIGGEKAGVMSKRAKWAFEGSTDAKGFTSENGGEIAGFEEALKASFEDMYEDIQMIRAKRQKR